MMIDNFLIDYEDFHNQKYHHHHCRIQDMVKIHQDYQTMYLMMHK